MPDDNQALRYNIGKAELHWLDAWPHALKSVSAVFAYGAKKYAAYNYKKGARFSESYACARRHMTAWFNGEDVDAESGQHHLAHAAWNILRLLDEQQSPSPGTQDDRPHSYLEQK
ncbi:MAG: hypothetical protein UY48_C0053G0003 [Candidatus Gottesmanbacteria bacterium GW2011_GWB1_49_7]|uniref:dATP/dGTP diphosphohydrolase N-terminal domain-containing protein n=1 Tax=Candidatus Gottesmanbacteria bacterium GW2011_GWB1_49_7 TaxID=1618448 RepID=A0A0G1VTL6_9BACT|nr:MAG: hypothetical protein UY48_C0053G0003 [Candidatus Gottesmanbacteria bacterium GW2011_GWB1_49_7]